MEERVEEEKAEEPVATLKALEVLKTLRALIEALMTNTRERQWRGGEVLFPLGACLRVWMSEQDVSSRSRHGLWRQELQGRSEDSGHLTENGNRQEVRPGRSRLDR